MRFKTGDVLVTKNVKELGPWFIPCSKIRVVSRRGNDDTFRAMYLEGPLRRVTFVFWKDIAKPFEKPIFTMKVNEE